MRISDAKGAREIGHPGEIAYLGGASYRIPKEGLPMHRKCIHKAAF